MLELENKSNEAILKEYEKFTARYIGQLDVFREYVDYYKKKYQIDIDVVVMHTEVDDAVEFKQINDSKVAINCFRKAESDIVKKTGIQEIDNEPKVLYNVCLKKVSDKPRGVIVCVVDKKNQIWHAFSYVIDGQKNENDKSIILGDDNSKGFCIRELLQARSCERELNNLSKEDRSALNDKTFELYEPWSDRAKGTFPGMCQIKNTDVCYIFATMFCVEMLKDGAKELKKCIENYTDNKQLYLLPLSLLRYIHSQDFNYYISNYYQYEIDKIDKMSSGEEKEKQLQYLEDIKKAPMATDKNGDKINIFAIKELFKYFKENMKQAEGYENIIRSIIDGNLDNSQREYFKSNISFVGELCKYDIQHNGIIERKSWWDKALSFGENNAKNRRINQLAKIMNYEFTRNIVDDKEGTRANKKEIFKRKPKAERKMKEITFDDLLSISHIHKRCGCTGIPAVIE